MPRWTLLTYSLNEIISGLVLRVYTVLSKYEHPRVELTIQQEDSRILSRLKNWASWEIISYYLLINPIYGPNEAGAARVTIKHWWNFPMELCWFNWLKYLSDYKHINLIYISEYTKRNIYLVLRQRDKVFSLKPYYSAWALSKLILYSKTLNIACTLHSWT